MARRFGSAMMSNTDSMGVACSTRNILGQAYTSKEAPVNWNTFVRQSHRWLSIAFTLTVIANFVFMAMGPPPAAVTYSPLLPLALLLFSGLYLFALPYVVRWRSGRRASTGLSA